MTTRNKYIIDEQGIFNQELEKLPECKDTEKVLRTLEYMQDKAQITDGNQKYEECYAVREVIINNLDNKDILESSFQTISILTNEGEGRYRIGEDYYKIRENVDYMLDGLKEEYPQLGKYVDQTKKDISTGMKENDPYEGWFNSELTFRDYEDQVDRTWNQHKIDELRARKKAEEKTKKEIGAYRQSRIGREQTSLDYVVKNMNKNKKNGNDPR